jgi:hypothetical protein
MGGTHKKYHTVFFTSQFLFIFLCLFLLYFFSSWDDYEGYLWDGDQTKGFGFLIFTPLMHGWDIQIKELKGE